MTAPALPGAAPDPARLPPEVERALVAAIDAVDDAANGHITNAQSCAAEDALRTAIARALGGDGEPVAWAMCFVPFGHDDTAAKPRLLFDAKDRAEDVARRQSAFGVGTGARFIVRPMTWADASSRHAATGDTGAVERAARTAALYVDEAWRKGAPKSEWHPIKAMLMRDAIRAATGDHPSEARRGHESEGLGGPDAR